MLGFFSGDPYYNLCPNLGTTSAHLEITSTTGLSEGIWMLATLTNTVTGTVSLAWNAINAGDCKGSTVMGYIGTGTPTASSQFTDLGVLPSTNGQSYSHSASMPGAGTLIYAAIGWQGPGSISTYPKAVDIDCVSVTLP